ncbi:MAG: hypothetical protein ACLQQ4_11745 [Bacteroidia bacterium]
MTTAPDILKKQYDDAIEVIGSGDKITSDLKSDETGHLDILLKYSEKRKAAMSVFITSLVYKILHPEQDIRNHQDSIANGYAGRTFDQSNITPFMKQCKFPAMASSGWLTRSFEQKTPFLKGYTGAITPKELKTSFLLLVDNIQNGADCTKYLNYILQGLIIKRNQQIIELAKPSALSISLILELLEKHFNSHYTAEGQARLPVLAFYAIYQCLMTDAKRFKDKTLLPIASHTSADLRSGRIGDIDIVTKDNKAFEAVEVKHGISITLQLVKDAYDKFQPTHVNRYYILTTADYPEKDEWDKIQAEIQKIKNVHGCQLIVNGIMPSLKYYLRLLENTAEFINNYVVLLETDAALKYEHKANWNKLISEMQ